MATAAIGLQHLLNLGKLGLRDSSQRNPEAYYLGISQPVTNMESLAFGDYQPRLFQALEVLRWVRQAHRSLAGELLDRAGRLRQQVEQLKAMRVRHRARNLGE